MDNIVIGLFQSSHPDKVKRQIFRKMRLSAPSNFVTLSPDRQKNLINTCIHYSVIGSVFDHHEGLLWLKVLLSICTSDCYSIFTDAFFGNMVLGNSVSSLIQEEDDDTIDLPIPIFKRIALIDLLMDDFKLKEIKNLQTSIQIHIKTEAIRLLYSCNDHTTFAIICSFLQKHQDCLPPSSRYFALCSVSIHAMSEFLPDENKKEENYVSDIVEISYLIGIIWKREPATFLPSLREVFNIISSNKKQSNALGCLAEHIQLNVVDDEIFKIISDATVTDYQITTALRQMIIWVGWPNATQAYKLVLAFFKKLEYMSKFSILYEVTSVTIKQVFMCIKLPITRASSFPVLIYMLLGFQSSAEAFHLIVPHIPSVFSIIEKENNPENETYLKQLSNICQCMMYLHSGFPEMYSPILDCIKDYPKATKREIKNVLNAKQWTSKHFYRVDTLLARSEDTNKAGLVNLGNTCYINSVIQALFMIDEFRSCVLRCSPTSSSLMFSLYETFSYLLLTKRMAYEPHSLIERSRPSWFVAGTQQDCSEYLKYLLDCLNEEEKDCLRNKRLKSLEYKKAEDSMNSRIENTNAASSQIDLSSTVELLFHGKIRSCIICSTCNVTSCRDETFVDFAVPLNKADEREGVSSSTQNRSRDAVVEHVQASLNEVSRVFVDDSEPSDERRPVQVEEIEDEEETARRSHKLENLLEEALSEEYLSGDNQYHCQQCGVLRDAIKSSFFTSLPKYFIISLIRFTYNLREQRRSKILDNVEISQNLQLPLQQDNSLIPIDYTLRAVVFHSGMSAESGHYYCYAKQNSSTNIMNENQSSWYLFNDSHVSIATFHNLSHLTEQFSRDTAYVLIFARNDVKETDADGSEFIEKTLRQTIEKDNLNFVKEVQEAMKRAEELTKPSANVLGWDDDTNPPPPPAGGGGDGIKGPSLVF